MSAAAVVAAMAVSWLGIGDGAASIGQPGFALTASPTSQTVLPGVSTSYKITLVRRNGFIGKVGVAVTSVPRGVKAGLVEDSPTRSAWVLHVSTSPFLRLYCCYAVTVTGTSGRIVHTVSVTLHVIGPDFRLSAAPVSQSVVDGKQATYVVTLTRLNGFGGSPTLTVGGLPSGATSVFRPSSVQTTSKLIVSAGPATRPGSYHLVIVGKAGTVRRTVAVNLVVPAPVVTQYAVTLGTAPAGIVAGPDGALWFSDYTGPFIGRITTTGAVREFKVTAGDDVLSSHITVGPDRALWFTRHVSPVFNGWNIGRFTTSGQLSTFSSPTDSGLDGIATGPNGENGQALWFTEWDAHQIGEFENGGFQEFGPTAANPSAITQGPDGAMWFASLGSEIGRITTTGTITHHPFSGTSYSLTLGSDGALWFADYSKGEIGRMTTDGQVQLFPLPDGGNAYGITAGPDGALWFTIAGRSEIGRITTQGTITEYPYTELDPTTSLGGTEITTGPDGVLWFTEANAIGRITPP